jgi:hypothetical protein
MKVIDILNTVREDFLDDTVEPYRWGGGSLLRWLNRAQEEACTRQRLLVEEDDPTITQIALVADQAQYALDPRVVLLDRVVYDQKTITKATKHQLDRIMPAWRQMDPGAPMYYLQNDLTIRLIPTPAQAQDAQILTVRAQRLPLANLVNDTDVPEIPSSYHEDLCYYIAARAFMLPDEDTQMDKIAERYMEQFDKVFGPSIGADVLAHKRRETDSSFIGNSHAYHGRASTRVPGLNPFDFE